MISIIAFIQAIIFYLALASAIVLLFLIPLGLVRPKIFSGLLGKQISKLRLFIILLILLFLTTAFAILSEPEDLRNSIKQTQDIEKIGYYNVESVVDGDTIRVKIDGKIETVRLIGIDAPEIPNDCYGKQSKSKAREILINKQVR